MDILKRIGLIVLLLAVFWPNGDAGEDPGAKFLTWGVGARPSGMGEAFTAVADDGTAVYWNPAGLASLGKIEIAAMHSKLYEGIGDDMSHDFLSYIQPIGRLGVLGLGVIYALQGKHPITTRYNEITGEVEVVDSFEWLDGVAIVSYSSLLNKRLSFGLNLKYVYSKVYNLERQAYACDFGLLYKPFKGMSAGLVIKNLGTKISYKKESEGDPLPLTVVAGLAYKVKMGWGVGVTVACDIDRSYYEEYNGIRSGVECMFFDTLFLRAGYYDKGGGVKGASVGGGIRLFERYRFDFANIPGGTLGRNNRLSLNIMF